MVSVGATWAAAAAACVLCVALIATAPPAATAAGADRADAAWDHGDATATLSAVAARLERLGATGALNWTWAHGPKSLRRRRVESYRRRQRDAAVIAAANAEPVDPAKPFGSPVAARESTSGDSIFVSIASYRDSQCAPTIEDMFERARHPEAIFVGVVQQHYHDDASCIPKAFLAEACQLQHFCPSDNIQYRWIPPRRARGPTFGRYVGALMWRGEKYYMMIDSHNRFVTHWDAVVIRMHSSLPNPRYGVLSHYPSAWYNEGDPREKNVNEVLDNRPTTSFLCTAKFAGGLGYIKLDGYVVPTADRPRPQPWAAAGFLFADARLLQEVPFDPHLHYIFDGEEILFSVRMWTHGYDMFSPNTNVLYHYYYRPSAPKFWSTVPKGYGSMQSAAQRRVQWMLGSLIRGTGKRMVPANTSEAGVVIEADKYGLGTARSLAAWYEYAGVDPDNYTVAKKFCLY